MPSPAAPLQAGAAGLESHHHLGSSDDATRTTVARCDPEMPDLSADRSPGVSEVENGHSTKTTMSPTSESIDRVGRIFWRLMVFGIAIGLFGLAIGIAIGGTGGISVAAVSLGFGWIFFFVGAREYRRGRRVLAEKRSEGTR
jgi:hypothetical protein